MSTNLKHQDKQCDFSFIKGFQQATLLDWEGKIASIIFLGCCNFRCGFCHSRGLVLESDSIESVPFEVIDSFLYEKRDWIDGVVVTGGEPTIYNEKLTSLLRIIKDKGFPIKLDTNGTNPALLKELIGSGLVDYVAMDIKAPLERADYSKAAGVLVDIDKIIKSKDILLSSEIGYEFRTTAVPDIVNLSDISKIAQSISGANKYYLQQFIARDTIKPSYASSKPYSQEEIQEMASLASKYIKYVVIRNC